METSGWKIQKQLYKDTFQQYNDNQGLMIISQPNHLGAQASQGQ